MTRRRWLIFLFGVILVLFILRAFAADRDVEIRQLSFSYCPDVEAFSALEILRVRNKNSGYIKTEQELDAYQDIYQATKGQDVGFNTWSPQIGTAPKLFKLRVRLRNYSREASGEIPITTRLYAKTGDYLVHQQTFLVDEKHLWKTAKWVPFQVIEGVVPRLASQESYDYLVEPVRFGHYLATLRHQFPVALKAVVELKNPKTTRIIEMPVQADSFAVKNLSP